MSEPSPTTSDVAAVFQKAIAQHKAGNLQQAEQLYRAILHAWPDHPVANHNLGLLAGQSGQHLAALPYLQAAVDIDPSKEQYWLAYAAAQVASGHDEESLQTIQAAIKKGFNSPAVLSFRKKAEYSLLSGLFSAGRFEQLESSARMLVERYPDSGFAWKALGLALQMQGQDALPALMKATEYLPNDAEAHCNLANALRQVKQFEEALQSCQRAIAINPEFALAHNNLGNVLRDLGRFAEAVASYRRVVEIKPDLAEAHFNLGIAQAALGELVDAVESFHRVLEIDHNCPEVHFNLGNIYRDLGRMEQALASYSRALEVNPNSAEAHFNEGNVLRDNGKLESAVDCYLRALAINPDYVEANCNLGIALTDLGQLHEAVAKFDRALEVRPDFTKALGNLLFVRNYLADQPADLLLAEARRFGDVVARQAKPRSAWPNTPDADRCLRVGLVSGDLRNHPVGYFLEGVLAALLRNTPGQLYLIAYPTQPYSDALTERIKACCHRWQPAVALSDESFAEQIRDDGIDILIDLSGHTAYNRLPMFAWKPAPVQLSWLGYFATTGVAAIDYFIADPWTLPATEEVHFTERILRLPETRLCFTPPDAELAVSPLPALSTGHITFGCFNTLTKLNDEVVKLWAQVLAAVPTSRLFLKAKQLTEAPVGKSITERFAAHGVDRGRLILEAYGPRSEYLAAYNRVDIALDPFPFPGGTTSVESLWMGVPVLTLAGDRFLSRQGVGILMNAGLPAWVAVDAQEYLARAASFAGDLPGLAKLRGGLRQQVLESPLFDAPRFARHFESALRKVWGKWCAENRR